MDCPACKNAMITLDLADVEIDHCVSCGGIWLDAGELEFLLEDPAGAGRLLQSFQEDSSAVEPARRCPICERRMARIIVGRSDPPLLIDKCRRGDGLWFDKSELQDVLRRGQLDEESRIQRLLTDMFAEDREKPDAQS
jgi:Zn-finger nucleic acid-binding protein